MKKFWEKHDLIKVSGLMVLLSVILTWIIPQGYFYSGSIQVGEITRVGIFDFFNYGLLGMYYFTVLVTFLFVLGAFYQVLAKCSGYQKLTDSLAKTFSGKEYLFVLLVLFIISAITAVTNEYFVMLSVAPFFITILRKMGLDKMTGFITTFGGILVGILGSVYNSKVAGMNVSTLSSSYTDYLWVKLVIYGVSFVLFSLFTILHIRKIKKANKKDIAVIEEVYETKNTTEKKSAWPVATILILTAIVGILAYLPWEAWGVTIFSTATTKILECKVFDATIFRYILGNVQAFGKWDIFGMQILMLIAALLIKWIYKMSFDDFAESFGEGFKKSGKLVLVMLMAYLVLEIAVMFPVVPTIVDWFMKLASKFNAILGTIAGLFTSLFSVEYQYTLSLVGSYLTTAYSDFAKQIPIMLQSTYGLASMFAPSSAILLIGLSYLGITYKEWMKYIWKFVLAMFIVILVLMVIIC